MNNNKIYKEAGKNIAAGVEKKTYFCALLKMNLFFMKN